jgi:hypothetical protein
MKGADHGSGVGVIAKATNPKYQERIVAHPKLGIC